MQDGITGISFAAYDKWSKRRAAAAEPAPETTSETPVPGGAPTTADS